MGNTHQLHREFSALFWKETEDVKDFTKDVAGHARAPNLGEDFHQDSA